MLDQRSAEGYLLSDRKQGAGAESAVPQYLNHAILGCEEALPARLKFEQCVPWLPRSGKRATCPLRRLSWPNRARNFCTVLAVSWGVMPQKDSSCEETR